MSWTLYVISFSAAISACAKGGQRQQVAPLLCEIPGAELDARRDQLQRGHLSLRQRWAVAAGGAITQDDARCTV
eukprot:12328582-Karenia_brevis.AAC.1